MGSTAMNSRLFMDYVLSLALATAVVLAPQLSRAAEFTRFSGSYEVICKTDAGSNTSVRVRVHVTNERTSKVSIERIALRDFSHPAVKQVRACALSVPAGGSGELTQEFVAPRLEYESWQRGSQPKLILEILTGSGRRTTEVVPLTRISPRKGN